MTALPSAVFRDDSILLWDRDLAMLPDRSFLGGFFFRFVAARSDPDTGRQLFPNALRTA